MSSNVSEREMNRNPFETHNETKMKKALESIMMLSSRPGDPTSLLSSIRTHAAFGLSKVPLR